ncbi:MAG: 2OG-Fe(II) oxygenase family protein [Candidatus Eremiobacteraeota bacterium]|nr:2OG-Fe(II) oxygenase family protein [Candidatus Eremiobacteraeota bacterium]
MTSGASANALRWTVPAPVKHVPLEQLLPLARAGAAAAPESADRALQLAKTLFQADRMAELVDRFRTSAARDDASAELLYYLGCAATVTGDRALAVDALRAAADMGFNAAFGHLAEALRRVDRPDDALAAALRGLERSPSDFKSLGMVVRLLLGRGEAERLWEMCANLRGSGVWNAYVPSAMALAATTPAQHAQVAALVDSPRWFAAAQLGESGDAALAAELLAHASLAPLPSTKATSGTGKRIDHLQVAAGPRARDLLEDIRAAVDAYALQRQSDTAHPAVEHRPASVALNAWALAVHDDGHEDWHMHPGGWISGVYYVAVPHVDAHDDEHRGAIEFGPFPFGTERSAPSWPRTFVTPRAGMLLLFPSFYGHRTWPTRVAEPRIVVAFDVVPATATAIAR